MTSIQNGTVKPAGTVAVIGLGISGLTALKNLLEEGFDVTGFERNNYIGGLWEFSEDKDQISVLKSTVANTSKHFGCFTDFPFNDNVPTYPRASDIAANLQEYADHFNLFPHIKLGIKINRIERSEDGQAWNIRYFDQDKKDRVEGREKEINERFDKVVVCTGPWEKSHRPRYPNEEVYKGKIMVAKEYKGPQDFKDLKVAIVGMGNTACDVAVDLVGIAQEVYISHRSGSRICPRIIDGRPLDNAMTRQLASLMTFFDKHIPWVGEWIPNKVMVSRMLQLYPDIKPEWKLLPAPAFKNTWAVINDHIIDKLSEGSVVSLGGIESFTPNGIITDGGIETEIDVIVFCTGSYFDYSTLSPEANPTSHQKEEWVNLEHFNGLLFPRLYQNLFHPNFVDGDGTPSLAFIGACKGFTFGIHPNSDLISMSIAQIFKGNYTLPSTQEMNKWCDENYKANVELVKKWRTFRTGPTIPREFESFLNDSAGTSINEYLSWTSIKSWKFWWNNMRLYGLIVRGINAPALYRLFRGSRGDDKSRKRWNGALGEIYKANGLIAPKDVKEFDW